MAMREAPSGSGWDGARSVVALALVAAAGACDGDDGSATDLNPGGPPMVQQVFVWEQSRTTSGTRLERLQLAFGDHPDIPARDEDSVRGDDRVVDSAVSKPDAAKIRIVLDELLVGNHIEEIECADGSYSRVPLGTDPDDIERCAGADLSECEAVCIGPGGPIGINDTNEDGAVDGPSGLRMIDYGDGELAVSVLCDGQRMPLRREATGTEIDARRSFYNPSGNQLIPAGYELEGLGPALVLFPELGLRSGATCTIAFRPEVVDKDGNRVCAPPDGDVTGDCAGQGDTAAVQFQVEPFTIDGSEPVPGAVIPPGTGSAQAIRIDFVTDVDPATLGGVTLSTGGQDVPIAVAPGPMGFDIVITVPGGYAAASEYAVTVGTAVTDLLGGGPAEPLTFSFNTM